MGRVEEDISLLRHEGAGNREGEGKTARDPLVPDHTALSPGGTPASGVDAVLQASDEVLYLGSSGLSVQMLKWAVAAQCLCRLVEPAPCRLGLTLEMR
jgi:hypothetical protein